MNKKIIAFSGIAVVALSAVFIFGINARDKSVVSEALRVFVSGTLAQACDLPYRLSIGYPSSLTFAGEGGETECGVIQMTDGESERFLVLIPVSAYFIPTKEGAKSYALQNSMVFEGVQNIGGHGFYTFSHKENPLSFVAISSDTNPMIEIRMSGFDDKTKRAVLESFMFEGN